ncbi:MAG: hypothetical protein R3D00_29575 [Bacteroidia bacterium]
MRSLLLFFLITGLSVFSAFSQNYSGVGSISLTQKDLSLSSEQLVGRFIPDQHVLSFMVKTHSLSLSADDAAKSFLHDVLLMEANPLLSLEFDLNGFPEISSGDFLSKTINLPLTVRFNEHTVTILVPTSIEKQGNTLAVSAETDIALSSLAIVLSEEEKKIYDSHISLAVNQAVLTRR